MTALKALAFVELDLKRCSLTYGVSPCTATTEGSDATGTKKCYNSPFTCQDAANFSDSTLTLRFAIQTDYLPMDVPCIPSIKSINTTPQIIDPAETMGQRESVSISFTDHPFNDVGIDKYHSERGFNPFNQGTFWAKFKARWPYIQGSALRVIRGFEGQSLDEMETRNYIVDSTSGPANNLFTIVAKDYLKLLDGDKAQAPVASKGILFASITAAAGSLTLSPAGIGNAEYPSSGIASIGDEQVTFTRVNDTVTLTARGVDSSGASAHEAGETFQLGLWFDTSSALSGEPSEIIEHLITNYTTADSSWIDVDEWLVETETYIGRLYTAKILKPTSVRELVNELINQVGLVIYSDVVNQKIVLKALRQFSPLYTVDDGVIIEGTFKVDEQQEKRVSQVYTFFGQKNPLENQDELKNYRSVNLTVGANSIAALEDREPSIRKIYSRWINVFNRPAASDLNEIIIRRYENAPLKFSFQLPITENPVLGAAINISSRYLQTDEGEAETKVAQIISINKTEGRYSVIAEEMTFVQQVATDRLITIDSDNYNLAPYGTLRAVHDAIYDTPSSGDNVTVVIGSGVKVGSTSRNTPAFNVGSWPAGVNITIINKGRIQGRGGNGAIGQFNDGQDGGVALYSRFAIDFDNTNGKIWGGGGGGGGSGGVGPGGYTSGGGAGYKPGVGNSNPPATIDSGGGRGGDPGQDGTDFVGVGTGHGGDAGAAIDGDSFITFSAQGSIRGPRIN